MSRLSARVVKRPRNLVIEIRPSLETVGAINRFLSDKKIFVDDFQYYTLKKEGAFLYLHCHIEQYIFNAIMDGLAAFEGVIKINKNSY